MRKHILREYRETHDNWTGETVYTFTHERTDGRGGLHRNYQKIRPASYGRVHDRIVALECYGELDGTIYNRDVRYTVHVWETTPIYHARKQEGG